MPYNEKVRNFPCSLTDLEPSESQNRRALFEDTRSRLEGLNTEGLTGSWLTQTGRLSLLGADFVC